MSEFLNHLEKIAGEQKESQEAEELPEVFENQIMDLENLVHSFRRSEVAEFLKEENEEDFILLWKRLEDDAYKIQKLLPLAEADEMDFQNCLHNLAYFLRELVVTFKKGDDWYQVRYADNPYGGKEEKVYDFFESKVSLYNIKHNLLTTQQWHDLSNEKYVEVREIDTGTIKYCYKMVVDLLAEMEKWYLNKK